MNVVYAFFNFICKYVCICVIFELRTNILAGIGHEAITSVPTLVLTVEHLTPPSIIRTVTGNFFIALFVIVNVFVSLMCNAALLYLLTGLQLFNHIFF